MDIETFNCDLLEFLAASPTPFHAVQQMEIRLSQAGFVVLREADDWTLHAGGRYCVIRNSSSIVAFTLGEKSILDQGLRMVGAHTDSPCLKVKPQPELFKKGYFQLGVEVYGGALLNPWFDRDLSLAGRVSFRDTSGNIGSVLIDFKRAIATIPSLAIHLDREANSARSINAQTDIPPVVMQTNDKQTSFRELLLAQIRQEHPSCEACKVLDYELSFYDAQPAAIIGLHNEFIASARLDNLLSCYIGLQAILADSTEYRVLVCNDHEEIGSQSAAGAQGPMLRSVISRLLANEKEFTRTIDRSMMISVDNAHGVHPNFSDRHDANHGPLLNGGPVIKINANQRYATNSETSSLFRHWCESADEPVQAFVVRTDMGCGSTIGPITASEIGVQTLDIGVPTFAMHSIRELAGSSDAYSLYKVLEMFYRTEDVAVDRH
ncbi:putative aminopeptidase 2 [marine gamma proteobacterium HTCC2143]|jgi:aspartyl aminopeptidase|uniref:M18 family aminopeptidase n=1 Tax=marine gamma proteobacterium HTCC2143 TaxID=247633 RepID=A0YCJ1_9GAMM|nr:putative aminopeptidase 2 [marine gamma proteobacterium HTCC2143]